MQVLEKEILKNLPLSAKDRRKLVTWMEQVEAVVAAYNAHLANATSHNSADTTNDIEAGDIPDVDGA